MKLFVALLSALCLCKAFTTDAYNKNLGQQIDGHTKVMLRYTADKLEYLAGVAYDLSKTIDYEMNIFGTVAVQHLRNVRKKVMYELDDYLRNAEYRTCMQKKFPALGKVFREAQDAVNLCVDTGILSARSYAEEMSKPIVEANRNVKDFIGLCLNSDKLASKNDCSVEKAKILLEQAQKEMAVIDEKLSNSFKFLLTTLINGSLCTQFKVEEFWSYAEKFSTDIVKECVDV